MSNQWPERRATIGHPFPHQLGICIKNTYPPARHLNIRLRIWTKADAIKRKRTVHLTGLGADSSTFIQLISTQRTHQWRNNNVTITSNRRHDAVLTSQWRYYCIVCPLERPFLAPQPQWMSLILLGRTTWQRMDFTRNVSHEYAEAY